MIHHQDPSSDPLLAEFRRHLAEPGPWSARFGRLAKAIVSVDEVEPVVSIPPITEVALLSCDVCQELLDVYVADEGAGSNVRQTYPAVWSHLTSCLDCQMVYNLLGEMLGVETEKVPQALPPLAENLPQVTSTQSDDPWITRIWEDMIEKTFRLEFIFNIPYLQSMLLPQAAGLRAGPSVEPTSHLLLYNTVSVGEQSLTIEVTAIRKGPDTLELQAFVIGTAPLPSNLRAVLTWVDETRSVTVDKQGRAELGEVPLASLEVKKGHFGIALVSGEKAAPSSKKGEEQCNQQK